MLDVATGTGLVAAELLRRGFRMTGLDQSEEMLAIARRRLGRQAELVQASAESMPLADATFDHVTFTYLLRYVCDPAATVRECARVVRPGGVVASLEFAVPDAAVTHVAWLAYTRALLPVAGLLTGGRDWFTVGRFLGPSISAHYQRYPVEWHVAAWADAGIEDVRVRRMSLGGGLVMCGRRAGG